MQNGPEADDIFTTLANEMLENILFLNGDDELSLLKKYSTLNHACQEQVANLSRHLLSTYFSYTKEHPKFQENPLGLLSYESKKYLSAIGAPRFMPSIQVPLGAQPLPSTNLIELIFCALRKDFNTIEEAILPIYIKQNLYALAYAKHPELLDDLLDRWKFIYFKHTDVLEKMSDNDRLAIFKKMAAPFVNLTGNSTLAKMLHTENLFDVRIEQIVACGHPEIIKLCDFSTYCYNDGVISSYNQRLRRENLLNYAASYGHLNIVKEILSSTLKSTLDWKTWLKFKFEYQTQYFNNYPDPSCDSILNNIIDVTQALHVAAINGHTDIVKYLLSLNHPFIMIDGKYSALIEAHSRGHSDIVKQLFKSITSLSHLPFPFIPKYRKYYDKLFYYDTQRKIATITAISFLVLCTFPISWATLGVMTLSIFLGLELRQIYRRHAYKKYEHMGAENFEKFTAFQKEAFAQGVKSGESYFEQCKSTNPFRCVAANWHWQAYYAGQYAKMLGDNELIDKVSSNKAKV